MRNTTRPDQIPLLLLNRRSAGELKSTRNSVTHNTRDYPSFTWIRAAVRSPLKSFGLNQPLVEPVTRTTPSRKKQIRAPIPALARPEITIAICLVECVDRVQLITNWRVARSGESLLWRRTARVTNVHLGYPFGLLLTYFLFQSQLNQILVHGNLNIQRTDHQPEKSQWCRTVCLNLDTSYFTLIPDLLIIQRDHHT